MTFSKEYLQHLILKTDSVCRDLRMQALNQFLASGFPTTQHEDWKYTDVSVIANNNFEMHEKSTVNIHAIIEKYFTFAAHRLVFVNGCYFETSFSDQLEKNIIISHVAKHQDKICDLILKSNSTGFAALNDALFQDGAYIDIPENINLKIPIHILYIQTENKIAQMNHFKNFISIGANGTVTIYEDYVGVENSTYFNNIAAHIISKPKSILNYYRLQRESKQAFHIAKIDIYPLCDSIVNTYHIQVGAKLGRHDLNYCFNEKSASGNLLGLYYGSQNQHLDFHTCVDHAAEHNTSHQNYRGIMFEYARGVFNGKIIVRKTAQKTSAHLKNRNLLLSEHAEIDTKPELMIDADDVQCSHGATVGCLDEQALFYLKSRGISEEKARKILIQSFAGEILDQLLHPEIQSYIRSAVMQYDY